MYQFLSKKGSTVAFVLGAALSIIFLAIVLSESESLSSFGDDLPGLKEKHIDLFNFGIFSAIALAVLTAVAAVAFGLLQMLGDIKGSLKGLIGIGALIVLYLVFSSTATHETVGDLAETMKTFEIDEARSKMITGAIWTTLIAGIVGVGSLVIFEVVNAFK